MTGVLWRVWTQGACVAAVGQGVLGGWPAAAPNSCILFHSTFHPFFLSS